MFGTSDLKKMIFNIFSYENVLLKGTNKMYETFTIDHRNLSKLTISSQWQFAFDLQRWQLRLILSESFNNWLFISGMGRRPCKSLWKSWWFCQT